MQILKSLVARVSISRLLTPFVIAAVMSACNGKGEDSVTVEGDVPVAYVKRPVSTLGNPTDAITFTAGGDLFIREKSSPSAPEINVTSSQTGGRGDVSDPEVSYDGRKLLFSMRRNVSENWRVWEYDIAQNRLTQIVCNVASGTTPDGDDVDPAYLPDGRIVFASNRQEKSRRLMDEQQPGSSFAYLDEYERERTTALHVMNANGSECRQISFNQSHDRNPTVLRNGAIMYSRWDHIGERNQFSVFTINPDGTKPFVLYGAHSPGNSYLHPREMPNGQVLSTLMPLSGTDEGGALMQIDIQNFSENCEPATTSVRGCNGQQQPTAHEINFGMGLSPYGRFSTPYPLWDGTPRVLVTWTPSCAANGESNCPTVRNPVTGAETREETTPVYGVYMLNLNDKTLRPVVTAPAGYAVLDPVAIQPRPRPAQYAYPPLNDEDSTGTPLRTKPSSIGTTGVGILNVKSVYDTDGLQRMGNAVLIPGLNESIPRLSSNVPDLLTLKDPARTPADRRPARFIRITKAVPTQQGISREAIGETDFEMQQILGYAEVEPDGSFKIEVPADIPLAISVLDKNGRGFTPHTSWLQVRPGETLTCNGCHSPRRGSPINDFPITGTHPNTVLAGVPGESMAETRTRLNPSALQLNPHIEYRDVWTDTRFASASSPISIPYTSTPPNPSQDLTTAVPATSGPNRGVINYLEHIQPLWTKARCASSSTPCPPADDRTCIACHNDPNALDLSAGLSGTGRAISYDKLLIPAPILVNGEPVIDIVDGELVVRRETPKVSPGVGRASHLMEVIFNQELLSPTPLVSTLDHSSLLNRAEKRLVAEWIDLGAQYYNSPTNARVVGLNERVFQTSVHPILLSRCGTCHQAIGPPGSGGNPRFVGRRFVLTGQPEGDFNVTLSMIGSVASPPNTPLLRRASSTGTNPTHALINGNPVLPAGSDDYNTICTWIGSGTC